MRHGVEFSVVYLTCRAITLGPAVRVRDNALECEKIKGIVYVQRQSFRRRQPHRRARRNHHPAPGHHRPGRADRHPVLRHLPLGPAHRPRRVARVMPTVYPCVPGHEIVGRVAKVGPGVTQFKVGDIVGVGCLVGSDHSCPNCESGLEQFCPNATFTYNSPDKHGTAPTTYGGYSDSIVVEEGMVLRIPPNLDLAGAAPLLCAGITTYSPLKRNNVGPGKKVGVVGLGGLGHMGVKLAHAMGAHVAVFSTSPNKREDALRLGADEVVISRTPTRWPSTPARST